ncbi:MAG: 3'(2'),5'-bisphosphate nucleotidase CysQ [Rhizobiales bacterium]|nr:3'(2'),5'-bisphosphate nucleotidase CysQ [Hyphomicrobiales bacterium]|tara:strand:- start:2103 stop:2906 length:804 start_codon:yes stop_codon:yes gene_type:complete
MSSDWIADDLALLIDAAQKAGEIAHSYFGRSPETWYKGRERSPVSEADMASDRFLRDTLLAARPSYGWLSEETLDDPSRLARERIFIVDPIDGTRGFIGGKTDWCVSVAIVENGVAVVGALASPARGNIWWASRGNGAFLNSERLSMAADRKPMRPLKLSMPDMLAGKAIEDPGFPVERAPGGPSLALRVARVASGELGAVLVRPRSNEWDLAAADVLLSETGHCIVDEHMERISFNRPDPSHGFLMAAAKDDVAPLRACFPDVLGH